MVEHLIESKLRLSEISRGVFKQNKKALFSPQAIFAQVISVFDSQNAKIDFKVVESLA